LTNTIPDIFLHTFEQICILIIPGIILTTLMNRISGKLEAFACRALGVKLYMLLFGWLGTSVHELSHALMCIIFRHKIDKIQLFSLNPHSQRVGYVSHRYNPNSMYQRVGNFFIGTAPILVGSIVIFFSAKLLLPGILSQVHSLNNLPRNIFVVFVDSFFSLLHELFTIGNYLRPQYYIFLYILFCVGSSMKLSKADLKGTWAGFAVLIGLIFLINIISNTFLPSWNAFPGFMTFIYNIMVIVLFMNLLLISVLSFFKKIS
jgi:hypothetical protein